VLACLPCSKFSKLDLRNDLDRHTLCTLNFIICAMQFDVRLTRLMLRILHFEQIIITHSRRRISYFSFRNYSKLTLHEQKHEETEFRNDDHNNVSPRASTALKTESELSEWPTIAAHVAKVLSPLGCEAHPFHVCKLLHSRVYWLANKINSSFVVDLDLYFISFHGLFIDRVVQRRGWLNISSKLSRKYFLSCNSRRTRTIREMRHSLCPITAQRNLWVFWSVG